MNRPPPAAGYGPILRAPIAEVERIETPAQRASRLMAESKAAADEQVRDLLTGLARSAAMAAEIASGGDAYPAGVRDACARLAADVEQRGLTIESMQNRGRS